MWNRRELMTSGVMGGLGPALGEPAAQDSPQDREARRQMAAELRDIKSALTTLAHGSDLPSGVVSKLRDQMTLYLRGNGKFPDFCDVGTGVFYEVYDWHVKNAQPLVLGRQPDGRYAMQFMFTRLVLRPESDPGYISPAYDSR